MTTQQLYETFKELAGEISDLRSANMLIGWDQETKMPKKGVEGRAHVSATLASLLHEKQTSSQLRDCLEGLRSSKQDLDDISAAAVENLWRTYERSTKVPTDLVKRLAETGSRATAVWAKAKGDNDFASFVPILEEMFSLKREYADALGWEDSRYDALMDEYEPEAKSNRIEEIFDEVQEFLVPFVKTVSDSGVRVDTAPVVGPYSVAGQEAFGREVVEAMGFDLDAGRIDVSNHPFCSGVHAGDVRLTTHYKGDLRVGLLGTMHEAGHGLYEQNAIAANPRTPLGEVHSLGIHESQSRLWENNVGLGLSFWRHFYPSLQRHFPDQLSNTPLESFYAAMNDVRPSFIRIEADEVTYNLHVILRFGIEKEIVNNSLPAAQVRDLWNTRFQELFGITPATDDVGVLQDIHWAFGLVGYFPTYLLGSLNAAQFYVAAARDIPDLEDKIARGELLPLMEWLKQNVHRHGSRYLPQELMKLATGRGTEAGDFVSYVKTKYGPLYNV